MTFKDANDFQLSVQKNMIVASEGNLNQWLLNRQAFSPRLVRAIYLPPDLIVVRFSQVFLTACRERDTQLKAAPYKSSHVTYKPFLSILQATCVNHADVPSPIHFRCFHFEYLLARKTSSPILWRRGSALPPGKP